MKTITVIVASIICSVALADTVVPSDSVVNWVNVREEAVPGPAIPIVGHLHPDESAKFLGEDGSYFEIELENGVTGFVHKSWTNRIAESVSNIKIATFNIQVFGKTKAGKPDIMMELASIIRKYDIVAVQEIKNKEGSVPTEFLTEINSDGSAYTLVVSERSGLQPDDQSSQEQYAYYLNTESLHIIEDAGLFDDSGSDQFNREPYVARFGVNDGNFTFTLITVHTKPELAVEETKALDDVFDWAQDQFPDEDDFIALGDFNASCNFASPSDFVGSPIRDDFIWVIPDDADTNVSAGSACAYDRIVITEETEEDYADNFGVDNSLSSNAVSDHFPVWAEFHRNNDN
jgi:endonuclease/exonuclease/phosphatase family metal-dependent hydrolase